MRRSVLPVFVLLAFTGLANAQRLPHAAVPDRYQLTFTPNFSSNSFQGEETIDVSIPERTAGVTLNAVEIDFQEATITSANQTQKARVLLDPQRQFALLAVSQPLEAGAAQIHIRFAGTLNDKLRGFYLARANGRKYAFTQFEATDARRAFPSFDEPALKATFAISLVLDKGDTAISNGRIVSDTPGPGEGKHTLQFSKTPKMSSYLVAMAVGDFQCLEGSADNIPVSVCATPDKKELGRFALASAERILHYYDQYYGIKYPFGKLDMIAAPDFEAGAMENTAAIVYRETALLIDDKMASVDSHRRVFSVIAHEMAHQWFGDLVTMNWWDNIWLNEGFATWMSRKPLLDLNPGWNEHTAGAEATSGALRVDSVASTRPIRARAETSAQIDELFDGIAYAKTAAVLRMLESYVGPEVFRQGINAYLKEHEYGNAAAEDFWGAITKVSKKPVNEIMPRFVDQPGAPLVSVERQCDGSATSVTLEQQRYFFDRALFDAGTEQLWQIPVCLKFPSGAGKAATQCVLLTKRKETFELKGCAPWVFANAGAQGYYRSAYSAADLHGMAQAAEHDFSPGERIALLDDEWAMVQVGRHQVGDYLALAETFKNDRTPAVVDTILGRLSTIGEVLVSDSDQDHYRAWVRRLLRPLARELGWKPAPDEGDELRSLRPAVLSVLGRIGRDPDVLAQARKMTEEYLENPSSVDPTLAGTMINLTAAWSGDAALYDKLLAHLKTAKSPQEYYRYLNSLTSFRDPALLRRTLEYALSPEVRNQDAAGFVGSVLSNLSGKELAWTFVKAHWDELQKKLTTSSGRRVIAATRSFCDAQHRDDVRQFFTEHHVSSADRALQTSIEAINYCIDLKSQQEPNLAAWLSQQNSTGGR